MRRTKNLIALIAAGLLAGTASIYAQTELINPTTKAWKYSADNSDQYAAGFPNVDTSAWAEGLPLFGNDTTINYRYPFVTTILGSAGGIQTSYLQTKFTWVGSPNGVVFTMTNMLDDGAIFYLNGVEITRHNINSAPGVAVTHATVAVGAPGEPNIVRHQVTLDGLTNGLANPLVTGENTLSVSVHQAGTGSSDMVFGLSIHYQQVIEPCTPTVAPATIAGTQCKSATFVATLAADCGVPAPTLQWYHDGVAIPNANGLTLTLNNLQTTDAGQYTITASNPGGSKTSTPVSLTVGADTQGPRIVSAIAVAPNQVLVTFDEPYVLFANGGTADDAFTWAIGPVGAPGVSSAVAEPGNASQVRLTLDADMNPTTAYTYTTQEAIADTCAGASTAAGQTGSILVQTRILHWTDGRDWRYEDSGANQGTAWKEVNFDATAWKVGPQGFGNETGANFPDNPDSQRTPLPAPSATFITAYFRTTFRVPANAVNLLFEADVDDGAAIYVNGTEIGRANIAAGIPLAFDTLVANLYDPDASLYGPPGGIPIPASVLIPGGDNVLAIEVHQSSTTSSDVLMLCQITGAVPAGGPVDPPTISTQPTGLAVTEGRSFSLSVLAAPQGVTYQWSKDGADIAGATSATYTVAAADASSGGVYRVKVTNSGGSVTSEPASVVVRRLVMAHSNPWKYDTNCQDATLTGTPWYAAGFNDSGWLSGPAPLGVETTAGTLARIPAIATPLPTPSSNFLTTYFRSSVTIPALAAGESLYLTHIVDDGAAFYVDGNLAFVYNMGGGRPILCTTVAPGTAPGDGDAREVTAPIALSAGTHTLAVEVHQNAGTSSDIVFSAEITRAPALPRLTITHPTPTTAVLTWTAATGVRLFEAGTANGNFTAVAGNPQGTFTATLPAGNGQRFFRLGY